MENRKEDKIKNIEGYIDEFEPLIPSSFEEYKRDITTKAVCERYFEKIVEAIIDLAFIIIRNKRLKSPDDDAHAFVILKEVNLISNKLCEKMQDAKGMRNIIAHRYGEIDDEKVFDAVTKELIPDVRDFIREVRNV